MAYPYGSYAGHSEENSSEVAGYFIGGDPNYVAALAELDEEFPGSRVKNDIHSDGEHTTVITCSGLVLSGHIIFD